MTACVSPSKKKRSGIEGLFLFFLFKCSLKKNETFDNCTISFLYLTAKETQCYTIAYVSRIKRPLYATAQDLLLNDRYISCRVKIHFLSLCSYDRIAASGRTCLEYIIANGERLIRYDATLDLCCILLINIELIEVTIVFVKVSK